MHGLPVAVSHMAEKALSHLEGWRLVPLQEGLTEAATYVISREESRRWMGKLGEGPVIFCEDWEDLPAAVSREAAAYEMSLLPPFTAQLLSRAAGHPLYFATPGHHSGAFFEKTNQGRIFVSALGKGVFQADLSDSDDAVGDPSSHTGPGGEAESLAARVYHADRTYFVLNGTSGSNRICCAALLAPGDLVLFDRNHHKSLYQGAIEQCGAIPVYLKTVWNRAGVIGGLAKLPGKKALRRMAKEASPQAAKKKRPFRLACVQLATYDGIFVNAEAIVRRLGPLCDYILFDGAWAGYESWIPFMKEENPLALSLGKKDPGIFVTQSVHKQLAGFSQTSQIHRKDSHLPQGRRVPDDVFQGAYLSHISTSPCMPLLAGLEMNASIHREKGRALWEEALRFAIALRQSILARCRYIRPFGPSRIGGRPWGEGNGEALLTERKCWEITPGENWHGMTGIGEGEHLLDPCKVLLMMPGSWEKEDHGPAIPGAVLARYLEERRIVPEKSGFYTVLFLTEPGDNEEKRNRLVEALVQFEEDYDRNALLGDTLPLLAREYPSFYEDMTLQELCRALDGAIQAQHALKGMRTVFGKTDNIHRAMNGRAAKDAFVRGDRVWKPLSELPGEIALESAAAYPPGICAIAAGEVWTRAQVKYFKAMTSLAGLFPGLSPELQGIHEKEEKGRLLPGAWVYKKR